MVSMGKALEFICPTLSQVDSNDVFMRVGFTVEDVPGLQACRDCKTPETGGIVAKARVMKEAQLPAHQILSTAMGIEKMRRCVTTGQHHGDGIDAEIASRQIRFQGRGRHHRFTGSDGVVLSAGGGDIQEQLRALQAQLQLHRAVGAVGAHRVQLHTRHQAQTLNEPLRRPFHHQIEIQQTTPGIAVLAVQQQIAHGTTHQSDAVGASRLGEGRPESSRQSRQIHEVALGR